MTRHNLDSHITWLLSQQVTLPVGVHSTARSNPTARRRIANTEPEGEGVEQEDHTAPASPAPRQRQRLERAVNVGPDFFLRPTIPPNNTSRQPAEALTTLTYESMGKLGSASRSARPALISQQHQLATPTSTTSSSGLTQGYANFLRTKDPTPSAKTTSERLPSNLMRSIYTPQTPRHTPRQTPHPASDISLRDVEAVDLTGDDAGNPSSRSSSTEIWGENTLLWTEDAATRPEPLKTPNISARSAKKRKSDDITLGTSKKKGRRDQQADPKRTVRAGSEEFVDIDDMIAVRTQSARKHRVDEIRARSVRPSIEVAGSREGYEEEYRVTETIRTVETRTRKSLSRIPSVGEVSIQSGSHSPTGLPIIGSQAKPRPADKSWPKDIVQVLASPTPGPHRQPAASPTSRTPQKQQKHRRDRVIQDSDDEEGFLIEPHATCSPVTAWKGSSGFVDARKGHNWQEPPAFESSGRKATGPHNTTPRNGSPLRPMSRNLSVRQDNVPSPFQRDSPTKLALQANVKLQTSQQTPSSTLPLDEKKLVDLFYNIPSAITSYRLRVQQLKAQSAITCMAYIDEGETAPAKLQEERKRWLDMDKAYLELETLREKLRSLKDEKRVLAREIYDLSEAGVDTSVQDERSTQVVNDIRRFEKDIGRLLHTSGAIKDGFGSEVDERDSGLGPFHGQKRPGPGSLPQASSAAGSTQIILQTQFPSMQQENSKASPSRRTQDGLTSISSTSGIVLQQPKSSSLEGGSPSPVRKPAVLSAAVERVVSSNMNDWSTPRSSFKQPDFYHNPTPTDYGFDDFGENFEGMLEDEQELQNSKPSKVARSIYVENEYGESDDDGDMLELAQEVEQRQSFTEHVELPSTSFSAKSRKGSERPSRVVSPGVNDMYSLIDARALGLLNFKWSSDIEKVIKERFRLKGFRHHQLNAINATLEGKDVFVLMPTGGGKSLCYQLPAIIQTGKTKGVTVVISPLLSLMVDQVDHLQKIKIQAATLNGEVSREYRAQIMSYLREPDPESYLQLLYITPEMITKSDAILNAFSNLHRRKKLARIIIDEAHCVSQWGHDFRPDYVALGDVRKRFPDVPIMALTATATENVRVDVMHNLGMKRAEILTQSFNRPNLSYEVRSKKGKGALKAILEDIVDLIKSKHKNQTGIIYTLSKKGCEEIADKLQKEYKMKAAFFHAAMEPTEKKKVQRDWQNGIIKVVVATIAFGMGIDKSDVRFVIHHTIPKTLEGYYQETGRAGRDGAPSSCYLYYGYQDTAVLKKFIYDSEATEEQKEKQRQMLSKIVQYCENRCDCRRVEILRYFGEKFSRSKCKGQCDNCRSNAIFETVDFTKLARDAMQIVKSVQDSNVTILHCVDVLRGASSTKIKNMEHDKLPWFGAGRDVNRGVVERLFYHLLMENAIAEHNVVNRGGFATQYLNLGPECRALLTGGGKVELKVEVSSSTVGPSKQTPAKPRKKSAKSTTQAFTSTILTSPPAPPKRRATNLPKVAIGRTENRNYARDDSLDPDSDNDGDAFEQMPSYKLGPRITTDQNLAKLSDIHLEFIHQFVDEAKKELEIARNNKNLKKPIFTEANLRDMAVHWTTNLETMKLLPQINQEAVDRWGPKLIPLIEQVSSFYNEATNGENGRPETFQQHVIDLCTDDEGLQDGEEEDEDEDELDEDDEAKICAAEKGSKYFTQPNSRARWKAGNTSTSKKHTVNKGSYRPKSRGGGRKTYGRKSSGSTSGRSSSGVGKRRSSGGPRREGPGKVSTTAKQSNLMRSFGHRGTEGGGGIGMMPT